MKKARYRKGHGIHSPFLFHLITEIIENRRSLPEYKIFKNLKEQAFKLLCDCSDPYLEIVYNQFSLPASKPRRLYRKIELAPRYGKVVFRLLREFKPSSVASYGPTFGANLALMALANNDCPVYQLIENHSCDLISKELITDLVISNVHYLHVDAELSTKPEFVIVNYPVNPDASRNVVQKYLQLHGNDDVLIIRGIHESNEMEAIWQEMVSNENVRVSLDLFEIGIALFRKGLQKENFIFKF